MKDTQFKLYRFSPIQSEAQLRKAIFHIHLESHKLCRKSFGRYLENAGNIGVFCHYDDEYAFLIELRKNLACPSDNPEQKYFELKKPIVIPPQGDIPETTYTHLYIRKPDPYRHHVGDIDFYLKPEEYSKLKALLNIPGARKFPREDLDMIELHNPDSDVLAYVSTHHMTQKVRVKQSEETNL